MLHRYLSRLKHFSQQTFLAAKTCQIVHQSFWYFVLLLSVCVADLGFTFVSAVRQQTCILIQNWKQKVSDFSHLQH